MSRKLSALAAAFAFTALIAAAPAAHAQAQSDMVPPGAMPGAASRTMPMSAAPPHAGMHHGRAMRSDRRARQSMRREMRADRRAAANPDGAYMGGGGVFERAPDGSLRPVM